MKQCFVTASCLSVLLGTLTLSTIAYADEAQDLKAEVRRLNERLLKLEENRSETEARVDEVEDTMIDIEERVGDRAVAHAFEGIKLDIGGFLHSAYTYAEGENSSQGSFNRQNFELLVAAEISEDWSAFVAGGYLREANDPFVVGGRTDPQFDTNNRNPLIIGWVNYHHTDLLNVRTGRMITPHGVVNIEHFPATLLDPEQPQFLRPFGGNTLFPNFSTGVQLHGKTFSSWGSLNYATYITNATGTGAESNNEEQLGGRLGYVSSNSTVEVGFNFGELYRGSTNSDYTMTGVDIKVSYDWLLLKAEVYQTDEDSGGDRSAAYIQPAWIMSDQWQLFYRYDELDAGDVLGESTENVVGVNFLPKSNIRLRVTYTQKDFDGGFTSATLLTGIPDADADIFQLSGTFSF